MSEEPRKQEKMEWPQKNGVFPKKMEVTYDMAYLSSGKVIPNKKNNNLDKQSKKENLAA